MTDPQPSVSKADIVPHAHYMRPLDGIRGLACLFVVASHVTLVLEFANRPAYAYLGALGVLIFFVLSGFLMSALYSNEKFTFDKTAKYGIARFTRIAPAYWIAVIFVWILYKTVPDFHYQMTPVNMVRSFAFMGNQGVLWSIPPEVQFYGFFLLLWFSWAKYKAGNTLWLLGTAALCVALFFTKEHWAGTMLPSKLHIFLSGFLTAFLPKIERVKKHIHTIPFQAVTTVVLVSYGFLCTSMETIYTDPLFPLLIGLWIASLSGSTKLTAPLETDTMRLMGAASFSIYLFHEAMLFAMRNLGWVVPDADMLNAALMCVISLAIPVAFHFAVEKKLNIWSKKELLGVLAGYQAKYPKLKG